MANEPKLLPCPFCGENFYLRYSNNNIKCDSCGGQMYVDNESDFDIVVSRWNTRTINLKMKAVSDDDEDLKVILSTDYVTFEDEQ